MSSLPPLRIQLHSEFCRDAFVRARKLTRRIDPKNLNGRNARFRRFVQHVSHLYARDTPTHRIPSKPKSAHTNRRHQVGGGGAREEITKRAFMCFTHQQDAAQTSRFKLTTTRICQTNNNNRNNDVHKRGKSCHLVIASYLHQSRRSARTEPAAPPGSPAGEPGVLGPWCPGQQGTGRDWTGRVCHCGAYMVHKAVTAATADERAPGTPSQPSRAGVRRGGGEKREKNKNTS